MFLGICLVIDGFDLSLKAKHRSRNGSVRTRVRVRVFRLTSVLAWETKLGLS